MSDLRSAVETLLHTARHPREVYRGRGLERIAEVDANALDALRAALASPPAPAEGERDEAASIAFAAAVQCVADYKDEVAMRNLYPGRTEQLTALHETIQRLHALANCASAPRPPSSPDPAPCGPWCCDTYAHTTRPGHLAPPRHDKTCRFAAPSQDPEAPKEAEGAAPGIGGGSG